MKRIWIVIGLWLGWNMLQSQDIYDFELSYTDVPSTALRSGDFVIDWDAENGSLTVRHADTDHIHWASVPGKGFVGGAIAEAEIEELRGFFTIDDEKESVLTEQVVTAITSNQNPPDFIADTVYVSGVLRNDSIAEPYQVMFHTDGTDRLVMDLEVEGEVNRTYLHYALSDETRVFGFGAQCSYFNHQGNRVEVLVQEQGIGRGDIDNPLIDLVLGTATGNDYTSYISVPHYVTSDLNSFFLENYEISNFDFTAEDEVQVEVFSNHLRSQLIDADDNPAQIIEEYTAFNGRMRSLPDWAIDGAIIGLQGGTDKLYDVWEQLKENETPVAAFWIQDWVGQRVSIVGKQLWWNWELEEPRYTEYDVLLDSLNDADIELMGYINPFLVNVWQQKEFRRNQYVEAQTNGFLVKKTEDVVYLVEQTSFNSGILDLSNPETRRWIKDIIIDELIGRGFKGWMADFAEALPFDGLLDNADPAQYHNQYCEEWAQLNREAIEEAGYGDDIVFFSRSGYTRSPGQSTLFWMGDQMVNWGPNDGIKSSVTGILGGGLSGFSLNHTDIGGYATIDFEPFVPRLARTAELLRRWTEMNAFTAVFRTHEGLGPEINAQIYSDAASLEHFAKWANIYQALFFYRKQLVEEAAATGIPVVRHPFLHFWEDPQVYDLSYQQFMLGDQFMIAPVVDEGANSTTVYLPQGSWVDLWTGDTIESVGEFLLVNDLEDRPAVFYPEGSVVAEEFIQNMINLGVY